MKLNTNNCFLCCLITILIISLFISSSSRGLLEGLTGSNTNTIAIYGNSHWYGGKCKDAPIFIPEHNITQNRFEYDLSGTDILDDNGSITTFENLLAESDLSGVNAYYVEVNSSGHSKIHLLEITTDKQTTVRFSCDPQNTGYVLGPGKILNSIIPLIDLIELFKSF